MIRQIEERGRGKIFRISVMSGILSQVFSTLSGSGSAFLTKFVIMLNATPLHFAVLSAIGQVSQVFQALGAFVTRRRTKRKGVVLTLQFIGCGIALIYGILPFIFSSGNAIRVFLLLLFVSVSLLSIAGNAWIGWISDIIPLRIRARFFSGLSQYLMLTTVAVSYGFSLFIDHFGASGKEQRPYTGICLFYGRKFAGRFHDYFFDSRCRSFLGTGCAFKTAGEGKEDRGRKHGRHVLLSDERQ